MGDQGLGTGVEEGVRGQKTEVRVEEGDQGRGSGGQGKKVTVTIRSNARLTGGRCSLVFVIPRGNWPLSC